MTGTVFPGYVRFWERYLRTGISASEALNEAGVRRIANGEDNDETAAEVYLSAREGFCWRRRGWMRGTG